MPALVAGIHVLAAWSVIRLIQTDDASVMREAARRN
jgi:hypothetical protein